MASILQTSQLHLNDARAAAAPGLKPCNALCSGTHLSRALLTRLITFHRTFSSLIPRKSSDISFGFKTTMASSIFWGISPMSQMCLNSRMASMSPVVCRPSPPPLHPVALGLLLRLGPLQPMLEILRPHVGATSRPPVPECLDCQPRPETPRLEGGHDPCWQGCVLLVRTCTVCLFSFFCDCSCSLLDNKNKLPVGVTILTRRHFSSMD